MKNKKPIPPRRGTILIIVVALLVILALIFTAWITTATNDRQSSETSRTSTQIELVLESVRNMTAGQITRGAFGATFAPENLRIAATTPQNGQWQRVVIDERIGGIVPDFYIGSRYPLVESGGVAPNTVRWPAISGPVTGQFVSPLPFTNTAVLDLANNPNLRFDAIPASRTYGSLTVPALRLRDRTGNYSNEFIHAADTDRDGIADSLFQLFPYQSIEGVTVYFAVRVIDNNAAVNATTAYSSGFDLLGVPSPVLLNDANAGTFTSHVGLYELIHRVAGSDVTVEASSLYRHRNNSLVMAGETGAALAASYASYGEARASQLGRRPDAAGFAAGGTTDRTRAFSWSDSGSLASRYTLTPAISASTVIEQNFGGGLASAIRNNPTSLYSPSAAGTWYTNGVNPNIFPVAGNVINDYRPFLVGRNPLSNNLRPSFEDANGISTAWALPDAVMPAWDTTGANPRAAINTATWQTLYRTYWSLMVATALPPSGIIPGGSPFADGQTLPADPFVGQKFTPGTYVAISQTSPHRMFRSPLRHPTTETRISPRGMMRIRSFLAALNAVGFREMGATATVVPTTAEQAIVIDGQSRRGSPAAVSFRVTAAPMRPQLFITEIYAQTDIRTDEGTGLNPYGYIAIKLHNPYPFPIVINAVNNRVRLAFVQRTTTPVGVVESPPDTPAIDLPPLTINAGDSILLESFNPAGGTPTVATQFSRFRPASSGVNDTAPGRVTKRYIANLTRAWSNTSGTKVDREVHLQQLSGGTWFSVDMFDFTGINFGNQDRADRWHYARCSDPNQPWQMVYPGRYDGTLPAGRHQGTEISTWFPVTGGTGPSPKLEDDRRTTPYGALNIPINAAATYPDNNKFTINLWRTVNPAVYPYGGFGKLADTLFVPYIGGYRVASSLNANDLIDLVPLTMDATFAEDTITTNDSEENIGRFTPVVVLPSEVATVGVEGVRSYAWATTLFDYIATWQAPHDDYTPMGVRTNAASVVAQGVAAVPVLNTQGTAANTGELSAPIEGLININTAPARVLATLPFVIPDDFISSIPLQGDRVVKAREVNQQIGQMIVKDRRANGPYISVFELNRIADNAFFGGVPFRELVNVGRAGGLSIGVDWTDRFKTVSRVANLVTTKSDSFTVYIVVEGWRTPAAGGNPTRAFQIHRAYHVDRSSINGTTREPRVFPIPME